MGSTTKFEYSNHALKQMLVRKISPIEVQATISDPDITAPGRPTPGKGPTKVLRKTVEGRKLKVVVTDRDPPRVISVAAVDE